MMLAVVARMWPETSVPTYQCGPSQSCAPNPPTPWHTKLNMGLRFQLGLISG